MSLIPRPMLDFSKLKTPERHGQVLIAPEPGAWLEAIRANGESLRKADVTILDSTLACWRRKTRQTMVGSDDLPIIVVGHQPAFIHPGVWAKHVVATRVASAVDGVALNLVVDNDAPHGTSLPIPSVLDSHVSIRNVEYARLPRGFSFEQIERQGDDEVDEFQRAVREAMGKRYGESHMPLFFDAFSAATEARDWVDQAVAARRAVEESLGVFIQERRVSRAWCSPLLIDMLINAERFAASYNNALKAYRLANRIRGQHRPIPNLHCGEGRCEVAVWVYRADEPRRRLFVARAGKSLRMFAGAEEIGEVPSSHLGSCDDLQAVLTDLRGWRFRPRALTLTIWARLLLADLFVHGIGGAKYDRISDSIIADYYGLTPPHMACVSATLHLNLPHRAITRETVQGLRHSSRDMIYNPQRHLSLGSDIAPLIEQRTEAVKHALNLRRRGSGEHRTRRMAFDRIRELNAGIMACRPAELEARRTELALAVEDLARGKIARGREYFFALYDRATLKELLSALPAARGFAV